MKSKVVLISKDHGAKVITTSNPESVITPAGFEKLVNPVTKMVDSLPPELWKLQDGKLLPVTEEHEVSRRMTNVTTLPHIVKSVTSHDYDLAEALMIIQTLRTTESTLDDIWHFCNLISLSQDRLHQRHDKYKKVFKYSMGGMIILWLILAALTLLY